MKNLSEIIKEGILSSIDSDVESGVEELIYDYFEHPEQYTWAKFYKFVNKWAQQYRMCTFDKEHLNQSSGGNKPVIYICKYIDNAFEDSLKFGVKTGDQLIVLFLTRMGGALVYSKGKSGKAQVKKISSGKDLTIASVTSGGTVYHNINTKPWYDTTYRVLRKDVDEYLLPMDIVKKLG